MTTAPATPGTGPNPPLSDARTAPRPPVAAAAFAILEQCRQFVGSVSDHAYAAESRSMPGGPIGKHVRHSLDHFAAALVAGEQGSAPIEYDRRARNVPMETDRSEAIGAIADLHRKLAALTDASLDARVRVRVMLSGDGQETELSSTLARELAFATHHAIHHHAMIKTIASEFGCSPAAEFGKAPSTLHHEAAQPAPRGCGCSGGGCGSRVRLKPPA